MPDVNSKDTAPITQVRPRCNEGWASIEKASKTLGNEKSADFEVVVASKPTPTGFIGTRVKGDGVSIVYDAAVGLSLPAFNNGDGFRLVDAAVRAGGKEIAIMPWTEMYRV